VVRNAQFAWNWNLTADLRREQWANFTETGPGIRYRLPRSAMMSLDFLRGAYTRKGGHPHGPNFFDLRMGLWYAFTY
jgi:hypothetical protein